MKQECIVMDYFSSGKPSPDPDHPDYLPTVFKNRPADSATSRKFQRPDRTFTEGMNTGKTF